jgi:hypothetical protein
MTVSLRAKGEPALSLTVKRTAAKDQTVKVGHTEAGDLTPNLDTWPLFPLGGVSTSTFYEVNPQDHSAGKRHRMASGYPRDNFLKRPTFQLNNRVTRVSTLDTLPVRHIDHSNNHLLSDVVGTGTTVKQCFHILAQDQRLSSVLVAAALVRRRREPTLR